MAATRYSIVSSYQLMENHISAAVLDSAHGFGAHLTPAGATVLLSIGNDAVFRASVEAVGTQTGWAVTDISPLLLAKYESGTTLAARSFAASGNVVGNSGFAVLLAVTATTTTSSFDEVWLLTGPPGVDPSRWLVGGGAITFTKLAYDPVLSPPIEAITADTLRVTGLYLESGLEATGPALALATVADPGAPGELRCFLLHLAPGARPVWNYYQQEQNISTANLQLVPGRIVSDSSWGLYKLYTLGAQTSLTYLPTGGIFGLPDATMFTVPPGATAMASLVYQPDSSGSAAALFTDLFVAADGFIGYFPYNQNKPHKAVRLIASPLVSGVTQLHAVNCRGSAVLWGLNGAEQLFYTTAPLADRATPSAWQPPIALSTGITDMAALAGTAPDSISLFAVAPLGGTTTTGNSGSGLIQLGRNPSTGAWTSSVHPLPSTTDCITLKTYTTRVLLVDSDNVPQPGASISAAVSADCSLIINGAATRVSTRDAVPLETDSGGYVNIVHAVSSLATPRLTLTLPDGSLSAVDPTGAVIKALAGVTSPDHLASATYTDGNGQTRKLVRPGTSPDAVKGVVDGLRVISAKIPDLPTAAAHRLSLNASSNPSIAARPLRGDLFSDLGDLVQWTCNVVEEVDEVVFEVVDEAVHLVVTVAETAFRAMVNTVEDALHSITALFQWIGAEIDAVFRWLAFLFDWSDFVAVKNALKEVVRQSLGSFAAVGSRARATGDEWFAHAREAILPNLSSTPMVKPPPNQRLQDVWAGTQPTPKTDMRSDPRLGWLKDRANTPPSSSRGPTNLAQAQAADGADPTGPLLAAIQKLISDMLAVFKTAFDDLGKVVITGEMTAADFFPRLLTSAELLGLDGLQAVFDALMAAQQAVAATVLAAFETPVEMPVLSALYRAATGGDLTLLDAVCLVLGIGVSLVYKIASGGDNPLDALSSATPAAVNQAICGLLGDGVSLPPLSDFVNLSVASSEEAETEEGEDEEEEEEEEEQEEEEEEEEEEPSPDGLQKITGALLVVQALTLGVEGGAEMTEAEALCNVAFTADLTVRTLRLVLEILDNGEQMKDTGTEVVAETIWSAGLLSAAVWKLKKDGFGSEFVNGAGQLDASVSLLWGIWHLKSVFDIVNEEGRSCPVGLTAEAFIEVLEPLQLGATLSKEPRSAGVLLALRAISAIVAGAERF
ncbi:hypothetical protein VTK26DRAFT_6695 [Humicola hyalothermophila]